MQLSLLKLSGDGEKGRLHHSASTYSSYKYLKEIKYRHIAGDLVAWLHDLTDIIPIS